MTLWQRLRANPIGTLLAMALLAYGGLRFFKAALLPASHALAGDFAAVFPSPYFARFRPDFPTNQVWDGGWYAGPMLHFLTLPLFALPRWWMVPPAWALTNLCALAVSFVSLRRLSGVARQTSWLTLTVLAALWLLFQPLGTAFASGNIEIVEMALILAAVARIQDSERGERGGLAGAFVGAAAMLKFLPVGFLGWFLLKRQWRAVWAGVATIAVTLVVTAVTLGWKESVLASAMGSPTGWSNAGLHELSITSMFLHWSGVLDVAETTVRWFPSSRADVAAIAGQVASALVVGGMAVLLFVRRNRRISPLEVSVLFLTMFIAVPRNHDYYYVFALVPVSVLLLQSMAARNYGLLAVTLAAYVLISPPVSFAWLDRTGWFPLPFAYVVNFHNLPVIGGLLLWIAATHQWREAAHASATSRGWSWRAWGVTAAVGVAAVYFLARPAKVTPEVSTVAAVLPSLRGEQPRSLSVSPAGDRIAYVAQDGELCLRSFDQATSTCWPDTRGARAPFFSPDGRWIAFIDDTGVKKVRVSGGSAELVTPTIGATSGSWDYDGTLPTLGRDGVIIFTTAEGIRRVEPDGSSALIVRRLPGDGPYLSPVMLPAGDAVLFSVAPMTDGTGQPAIMAHVLDTNRRERLLAGTQPLVDRQTGRLLFASGGRVLSVAFTPATLDVGPVAVPIAGHVAMAADGSALFGVSSRGDIAYVEGTRGPMAPRRLMLVDRAGVAVPLPIPARAFESPRLSPDGRSLLAVIRDGVVDSWRFDMQSGVGHRLFAGRAAGSSPVWSADGGVSIAGDGPTVWTVPEDGSRREPWRVWAAPADDNGAPVQLGSWSRDGKWLVGTRGGRTWLLEILSVPDVSPASPTTNLARTRVTWFETSSIEQDPVLSPDGRWLAYSTMVDGGSAIQVRLVSGTGEPRQVSVAPGATEPLWSSDGRELFYRQGDALMSVAVNSAAMLVVGRTELLFRGTFATTMGHGRDYDVTPDGKHFVMVSERAPESFAREIRVVRHWAAKLPR